LEPILTSELDPFEFSGEITKGGWLKGVGCFELFLGGFYPVVKLLTFGDLFRCF
jgi:hypothetical protein